jgi:two-component system, NarL family, invasion response regulator UvrY
VIGPETTIALVDDHAVVRQGYRRLLERETGLRIVGEAGTATQARSLLSAGAPELLILDLTLPDCSGIQLLSELVSHWPSLRIIIFSMHEESIFASRSLQAGAWGYVTKSSDPSELVRAVHEVVEGRRFLSSDIARKLALHSLESPGAQGADPLTEREIALLRMLAEGRSIKEIAHLLGVSDKTVANAQSLLRRKLGASSPLKVIERARHLGLLS